MKLSLFFIACMITPGLAANALTDSAQTTMQTVVLSPEMQELSKQLTKWLGELCTNPAKYGLSAGTPEITEFCTKSQQLHDHIKKHAKDHTGK